LKGLDGVISMEVVQPVVEDFKRLGWQLDPTMADLTGYNFPYLKDVYAYADPTYDGRWTVPVLWDKYQGAIVNNESSEIIRMLNSEFNAWAKHPGLDLYPLPLRNEIDKVNTWVYDSINNGVYKCGFATTQEAYEEAFDKLFDGLDRVETILAQQPYLAGDYLTEADVRLFTTLVRFDAVYYSHFKCNKQRIVDYSNIWDYLRELFQMPALQRTVKFDHIKQHYYKSHTNINPTRIVPKGPDMDLLKPHTRGRMTAGPPATSKRA